jgi:putative acetyltransferase
MKRLYVRPAYRGAGLAKRLVDAVVQASRQAGYIELRLDTLPAMAAAQTLYRRMGFVEIPPYGTKISSRHALLCTRPACVMCETQR